MALLRKSKGYLKKLVLLFALSYGWRRLKQKVWSKAKKEGKKEIEVN